MALPQHANLLDDPRSDKAPDDRQPRQSNDDYKMMTTAPCAFKSAMRLVIRRRLKH
jgi:hypothetical protein